MGAKPLTHSIWMFIEKQITKSNIVFLDEMNSIKILAYNRMLFAFYSASNVKYMRVKDETCF